MEKSGSSSGSDRGGKAARTRDTILAAVADIVATEGEAAVTTTAVAARAGMSVGAVYRYFASREALLLGAYDAAVAQLVETCRETLGTMPADMPRDEAARQLLGAYLSAAEAQPAHAGLLRAMRALRPVEADREADGGRIADNLLAPFVRRYGQGAGPATLRFLNALLGTLVDLYLVTDDPAERRRLRADIEAHILLALDRAGRRD